MNEFLTEKDEDMAVQQAVVESLAADKAEQDELIESLKEGCAKKDAEINQLKAQLEQRVAQVEKLSAQTDELSARVDNFASELNGRIEEYAKIYVENKEKVTDANRVTLLERNTELEDRYEGETYDHVLEALSEAQKRAEADGHLRKAQVLEGILVANEPTGALARRRANLEKFFNQNQNILNGEVIQELDKQGLTYKIGDKYLLLKEIVQRNY